MKAGIELKIRLNGHHLVHLGTDELEKVLYTGVFELTTIHNA